MLRRINHPCLGVQETFGRFRGILKPGWHVYIPFVTTIHVYDASQMNNAYALSAKTSDNVFCMLKLNVVTKIADVERYRYAARDPRAALEARVEEVVRNAASDLDIEALFAARKKIQNYTLDQLTGFAEDMGFVVCSVAITEVEPEPRVREAMSKVNAALRERQAAAERAEADKVAVVKEAEADAERKRLQGQGIADMRNAIIGGYRERISELADGLGMTPREAIAMTLTTQYVEGITELAKSKNTKVLFYSQDAAHTIQDVSRQFSTLFVDRIAEGDTVPVARSRTA